MSPFRKITDNLEKISKLSYENAEVVKLYSNYRDLQKPERTILDLLKPGLKNMKMLDIGVGAGRTTAHFAHLTKEYVGIDFSESMIEVCEERFANTKKNISFALCNVRNMKIFEDHYFDLILFSFNGLDCLDHTGRLEALREIRRVCKEGGLFCFSSHNVYNRFVRDWSGATKIKKMFTLSITRLLDHFMGYSIVMENECGFTVKSYYIRPEKQIEQLIESGFKAVRVFSLEEGKEIKTRSDLNHIRDCWLYYLCST